MEKRHTAVQLIGPGKKIARHFLWEKAYLHFYLEQVF